MLEDKTHKIKVWDHNDAVIYVKEKYHHSRVNPDDPEKYIHKEVTNTLAVIPVNSGDTVSTEFIEKVQKAADVLAELYSGESDSEVSVGYIINSNPYVNC
jgi:hypothetical protein